MLMNYDMLTALTETNENHLRQLLSYLAMVYRRVLTTPDLKFIGEHANGIMQRSSR